MFNRQSLLEQIAEHANRITADIMEQFRCIPISYDQDSDSIGVLVAADYNLQDIDDCRFTIQTGIKPNPLPPEESFDFYLHFAFSRQQDFSPYQSEINCDPQFRFQCPKDWFALTQTENDFVRHCDVCDRHVLFCHNDEQLQSASKNGLCAAFVKKDEEDEMMFMGDIMIDSDSEDDGFDI